MRVRLYFIKFFLAELSEIDDSFLKGNHRRNSDIQLNNSYRFVNEKIIKLKKFEFDFANLVEVLKNLLVVNEIVIKNLFDNNINNNKNEMISSDTFKNYDNVDYHRNKIEVIDKILFIAEDTLNYKINEPEEDLVFIKKVTIRYLKNYKCHISFLLCGE